jgi:hypothetical protein
MIECDFVTESDWTVSLSVHYDAPQKPMEYAIHRTSVSGDVGNSSGGSSCSSSLLTTTTTIEHHHLIFQVLGCGFLSKV